MGAKIAGEGGGDGVGGGGGGAELGVEDLHDTAQKCRTERHHPSSAASRFYCVSPKESAGVTVQSAGS